MGRRTATVALMVSMAGCAGCASPASGPATADTEDADDGAGAGGQDARAADLPRAPIPDRREATDGPSLLPSDGMTVEQPPNPRPADAAAALDALPAARDASAPPMQGSKVSVGARVVFAGDFETGNFAQWGNCQSVIQNGPCSRYDGNHYSLRLVSGGGQRQGMYAARFELRNGDVPNFGGGERTEVASSGGAGTREGDERWYEWSMKFEEGFPASGGWGLIVMQWHDASNSSPPLALHITGGGGVQIGGDGVPHVKKAIGPIRRGQWVDYVLHVKFSRSAAAGWVEAWENGVQTVPRYSRATMRVGDNYLKMGIYRDSSNSATHILYQDGLRITAP